MADAMQTQPLGQPGEPCEQCGSPLAPDQRYCLNCGKRRGGPRVDYLQQMLGSADAPGASQPQQPGQPEPKAAEAKGERDYAPLAAVGGIAVLGLMLLVGVLIGKGNGSGAVTTPAPIVRLGDEAGSAASAAGSSADSSKNNGLGGSSEGGGKKNKEASHEEGGTGDAVQTNKGELEELENESGEEAAKNALKLPDKIATPGKPPPIDKSKPPGGGGEEATEIK